MKLFFLLLALPLYAFSAELEIKNSDFNSAKENRNFIRFDLETKKLGIFKSSVTGYLRSFKVQYDEAPKEYRDVTLNFKIKDMDTDLYARNDQMWNLCFEHKNFPEITLKIPGTLAKSASETAAEAIGTIRGVEKKIPFQYSVAEQDGLKTVQGKASLSIQALGIKDPSIGVASVQDEVNLSFHFVLPK